LTGWLPTGGGASPARAGSFALPQPVLRAIPGAIAVERDWSRDRETDVGG
ncbi:hypothetical protein N658DRAFT_526854, partial [Parathielavia hyrcaniae]